MIRQKTRTMTRRDFLKQGAGAAVSAGWLFGSGRLHGSMSDKKSRVVLIREAQLFDSGGNLQKAKIASMIDEGLSALFNTNEAKAAWRNICKPQDIVGIKTNVSRPPTPQEVNDVLFERVISTGVESSNISINDRGVRNDKVFKKANTLINVRPLKTHHWAGVGSLIKNYIMFISQPWSYHDDACADLGAIWQLPEVKGKTKLNILIMFQPLFHGLGPHHYNPKYTWRYNGMIMGEDPVAVDSVGLHILLAKRKSYFNEEKPLVPSPKHIQYAQTRHRIGIADLDKIELLKLGWDKDAFI